MISAAQFIIVMSGGNLLKPLALYPGVADWRSLHQQLRMAYTAYGSAPFWSRSACFPMPYFPLCSSLVKDEAAPKIENVLQSRSHVQKQQKRSNSSCDVTGATKLTKVEPEQAKFDFRHLAESVLAEKQRDTGTSYHSPKASTAEIDDDDVDVVDDANDDVAGAANAHDLPINER